MTSMTGYGWHEYQDSNMVISVEVKSWNNRYLEINLNMPASLNPLEEKLRARVKSSAQRGKVDVHIRYRRLTNDAAVRLDPALLQGYLKAFREAAAEDGISNADLTVDSLLKIDGLFSVEQPRQVDDLEGPLFAALNTALDQWLASRKREGDTTRTDISSQLSRIQEAYALVAARAPELEERIKTLLEERFTEMLGDQIDLQRVYAETAVMLVKYSISEELARLGGHLEECGRLIQSDSAVGKRLDFLCQEMNREMNTIGSKSAMLEISRSVIDMKDALENIREQVRNIE
ncbi:YicC/YloC family endoribonuclease [Spirochaeta dissipatitropha]